MGSGSGCRDSCTGVFPEWEFTQDQAERFARHDWLHDAVGAAKGGITTARIMDLTRGDKS